MKEELGEFETAVERCNNAQLDGAFAVLKYRQIGILRKVKSIAEIFNVDALHLIEALPTTTDGRLLDSPSRALICVALEKRHKELLNKENNASE